MKNLLLLSISLILSATAFAQNTSIASELTGWAVEQQYLVDRIAINYMAIENRFDRSNKIQSELTNDIAAIKKSSANLNRSTFPASLILETIKVEKSVNALLTFLNEKPTANEFNKLIELREAVKQEEQSMKEALLVYVNNTSTEYINPNALQVASAFNTQISLSHKAVICYLVNISDQNNLNPSDGAFSAIMSFESNLIALLEMLGQDETYQEYMSTVIYDWKIIEKQLTSKKTVSKDLMITMLNTLREVNETTLNYTKKYIKEMDSKLSATK